MNPYREKAYNMREQILNLSQMEEIEPQKHQLTFKNWFDNTLAGIVDPVSKTRALNDSHKYENLEIFGYMERSTYLQIREAQAACYRCIVDQNFKDVQQRLNIKVQAALSSAVRGDLLKIQHSHFQKLIDNNPKIYYRIINRDPDEPSTWPGINFITTQQYKRYKKGAYIEELFHYEGGSYYVIRGYGTGELTNWIEDMGYAQVEVAIFLMGYIQGLIEGEPVDSNDRGVPKVSIGKILQSKANNTPYRMSNNEPLYIRSVAMVCYIQERGAIDSSEVLDEFGIANTSGNRRGLFDFYNGLPKKFKPDNPGDAQSRRWYRCFLSEAVNYLNHINDDQALGKIAEFQALAKKLYS